MGCRIHSDLIVYQRPIGELNTSFGASIQISYAGVSIVDDVRILTSEQLSWKLGLASSEEVLGVQMDQDISCVKVKPGDHNCV